MKLYNALSERDVTFFRTDAGANVCTGGGVAATLRFARRRWLKTQVMAAVGYDER